MQAISDRPVQALALLPLDQGEETGASGCRTSWHGRPARLFSEAGFAEATSLPRELIARLKRGILPLT
jgi:hypothetical protein